MVDNYRTLRDDFRWHVPRDLNIAVDCCLKWAQLPSHDKKVAVTWQPIGQAPQQITFSQLAQLVSQLANGMQRLGVIPGDRVIVLMGRPIEALAVNLACWATGAVAVPLSPDQTPDALTPKIKQARGRLIFIDDLTEDIALAAVARCPRIQQIVGFDIYRGSVMSWRGLIARQPTVFDAVQSLPSNPALLIWPESSDPNFDAGTALMLAQQALIGNLPGFVMTTNWFPNEANGLLTSLLPWDEHGLMAAILPTLYFGYGVTIDERETFAIEEDISHVITTPLRWCQWLKAQRAAEVPSRVLRAVTLHGHCLTPYWRDVSQQQVSTDPNLALYIPGAGLALGQNLARWAEPDDPDRLRVVPGFNADTVLNETPSPSDHLTSQAVGKLVIARFDAHDHPNPAQYVQIWPLKESLDGSGLTEPPLQFETLWLAVERDANTYALLDEPNNPFLGIGPQQLNAARLEQSLLTVPYVAAALVMTAPQKKSIPAGGLWLLIEIDKDYQPVTATTRRMLEEEIPALIMGECGFDAAPENERPTLRIGLVAHIERTSLDQPIRYIWTKRAKFADIDFLPVSRHKA